MIICYQTHLIRSNLKHLLIETSNLWGNHALEAGGNCFWRRLFMESSPKTDMLNPKLWFRWFSEFQLADFWVHNVSFQVCVCVYGIRKFPPQQRVSDITIVIIDVVLTPFHQDTIATFTNEINDVKYQMYVYICIHTHVWLWSYMYILYLFLWYNPVNDWTYSFYTPTSLFFGTSVSLRLLWTLGQGEA